MDNLMIEKIKELLAKNETIAIAIGEDPGIDEMGAGLALYLALSETGKQVVIACPTDPIVEISSLVGIDEVKKIFGGDKSGDLTVSFPYKEGEIEKISYTLESGKLNILVKAGGNGLNFNEKDIVYTRGGGAPGLVFVIGTPRLSDLGSVFDPEALKDSKVINIDYKPDNQGFGDIPLLGKNSSSVSELVANFISSIGLRIDIDIASNLMAGIISATDNFQNPQTSSLAFETAAALMKKGAVRQIRNGKKTALDVDSFFAPKPQAKLPSFSKTSFGTEEKKASNARTLGGQADENNPPDDWLAPKIYKGSTSI